MWKALSAVNYGDKTKLVQLESLSGCGLSRALNKFAYFVPLIRLSIWLSEVWAEFFPVYVKYELNLLQQKQQNVIVSNVICFSVIFPGC